jgi:hypothetical protein
MNNDDLTEKAAALVDSMESAFGVQHTRPLIRRKRTWGGEIVRNVIEGYEPVPPPDLDEKINATKKALE